MTLLSLIIGKKGKDIESTVILSGVFYLDKLFFYQKSSTKELCNFITRQSLFHKDIGFNNIHHRGMFIVSQMKSSGLGICAVMDNDKYPLRVMHRLLNSVLNEFIQNFPEIWKHSFNDYSIDWDKFNDKLIKYQDPREADKLYSIKCNLDETTEIMYQNIENILARGEKIEDLVQRSSDLSKTSKKFYKTTRKMNRCCIIS
jgi:synaptobrevin homolog YKT6